MGLQDITVGSVEIFPMVSENSSNLFDEIMALVCQFLLQKLSLEVQRRNAAAVMGKLSCPFLCLLPLNCMLLIQVFQFFSNPLWQAWSELVMRFSEQGSQNPSNTQIVVPRRSLDPSFAQLDTELKSR